MLNLLEEAELAIREADLHRRAGRVVDLIGLIVEASGLEASVGEVCTIDAGRGRPSVPAEVVGFRAGRTLLMALGDATGIGPGAQVIASGQPLKVDVSDAHDALVLLEGDSALLHLGEDRFLERVQSYLELSPALRERVNDIDYVDLRFDSRVYVRPAANGNRVTGLDPASPAGRRRSVYRSIVRSVPDPFMDCLDCADPSLLVPRRNTTLTALQALAMLHDPFMIGGASRLAARVRSEGAGPPRAFELALGRRPGPEEATILDGYAAKHGLENACLLILNSNEFLFID